MATNTGKPRRQVIFQNFDGGLNSRDSILVLKPNEFSDGLNVTIDSMGEFSKRLGHTMLGNFIGATTGIQGGVGFENSAGTVEQVIAYDTGLYKLSAGVWTALTSVTMTTAKQVDFAYYPITDKLYAVNQTDNVVKHAAGASGDQSDSSFKKGKYIVHFKNRLLVANVTGEEDVVWYTDLGVDTFSANNYFRVEGAVTGMQVIGADSVLIFTKKKIYRLQNFSFDGVVAGPEAVVDIGATFGTIYDRAVVLATDGKVYFIAQDLDQRLQVYRTNGWSVETIGDKIPAQLNSFSTAIDPSGGFDGRFVRFSFARSTSSSLDREILYDILDNIWMTPNDIGFSCYFQYEASGVISLCGGDPVYGRVFQLNQATGYDETFNQSFLTGGDADLSIAGSTATRASQGFKLSGATTDSLTVTDAVLYMARTSGTATDLLVRIETDNSGVPTGTLADTNAVYTLPAFTGTAYEYKTCTFPTAFALTCGTQYHLVVQHATEGSGSSVYKWRADGSSPSYSDGAVSTYASGAWTADATKDAYFALVTRSAINSYAIWGSDFGLTDREKHIRRIFSRFDTEGDYTVDLGIKSVQYTTYNNLSVSLSDSATGIWGDSSGIWGTTGPWGGAATVEDWREPPAQSKRARFYQFKVSNNGAEETFVHHTTAVSFTYKQSDR